MPFKMAFTDLSIRKLKPTGRQYMAWDKSLPNFGIRVSQHGTMTWTLLLGSERRRVGLGRYPIISLAEARQAAKHLLAERTLGKHTPRTVTFREALDVYIATHASNNRTAYEQERVLKKHLLPALQSKKLSDIHYQHVAEIIDRIKTKPAANHLYTEARVFFNWTVKRRYLTTSPLAGSAQPHPSVTRDRVLSHAELRAIWFAAEEIGYPYGKIVQLLFWGQRRGETSKLRWEYITADQISFPAAIVKNKHRHTIPLTPMLAELISSLPKCSTMLFPAEGYDDRPCAGWSRGFARLEQLSGVRGFVLHDLRRTFATELASLGVAIHVIEKLLNHTSGQISGVAAIYNRFSYVKEMREAVVLWERHLAELLSQKDISTKAA